MGSGPSGWKLLRVLNVEHRSRSPDELSRCSNAVGLSGRSRSWAGYRKHASNSAAVFATRHLVSEIQFLILRRHEIQCSGVRRRFLCLCTNKAVNARSPTRSLRSGSSLALLSVRQICIRLSAYAISNHREVPSQLGTNPSHQAHRLPHAPHISQRRAREFPPRKSQYRLPWFVYQGHRTFPYSLLCLPIKRLACCLVIHAVTSFPVLTMAPYPESLLSSPATIGRFKYPPPPAAAAAEKESATESSPRVDRFLQCCQHRPRCFWRSMLPLLGHPAISPRGSREYLHERFLGFANQGA